jgi:RNA polymerase sigma-70 factor, ECF subfamily
MDHESISGVSIEELLRRARAGDEGALEELFNRCRPELGKWAARVVSRLRPGAARPSDLVQDTALHAFRGFSTFNGTTEAEWFAWLQQVLHNQTEQSRRKQERKKRGPHGTASLDDPEALATPAPEKSPSQVTSDQEEWRLLLAHLYQLPDDWRDAIWLCHLKELPVAEAARRMGRSEGSVAGLLQRGFKALKERMAKSPEAETGEPSSLPPTLNEAAAALLTYLQRRDAGEKVDPVAFIAEYPDCADELRGMLEWIERLQALRPGSHTQSPITRE